MKFTILSVSLTNIIISGFLLYSSSLLKFRVAPTSAATNLHNRV